MNQLRPVWDHSVQQWGEDVWRNRVYGPPTAHRWVPATIGQTSTSPAPAPTPPESFTLTDLGAAVRKITPTLLILGIATGAAFAIGSGLVHHFVFKGE